MFLFKALLLISSIMNQGEPTSEEIILQKLRLQTECWNAGDLACFMEGYWKSDELMFVGENITYGWQDTFERYKKSYPDAESRGILKFDILKLSEVTEDVYFVVGKFHLTRSIGDASGTFTLVWRKIEGDWLIVSDHTTAD